MKPLFDRTKVKTRNIYKLNRYYRHNNQKEIRNTLEQEVQGYVKKIHKIPDMFNTIVYTTDSGKIAVLELNTPKKRLLYHKAEDELITNDDNTLMKEFKHRYGFVPKPINVLKRYVDYGFMNSQDVEHLYHSEPVDYKISEDLNEFMDAYRINLNDKDILAEGFNGYSCMSEEPEVGSFYYYFGAYLLIFYAKGTDTIVGRMVLWKWDNQLYYYKGYVKSTHQIAASILVNKLADEGIIKKYLPQEFITCINCRLKNFTPEQAYDEIGDSIRVPYIDEDLCLSYDKTRLKFNGTYKTKRTGCTYLWDYGICECEECGREIDEEDAINIDGTYYCDECAHYCNECDKWFEPDMEGQVVNGEWICEDCLNENYEYCEKCWEFHLQDDMITYYEEDGSDGRMCTDCAEDFCMKCDDCEDIFLANALTRTDDGEYYCPECLKNHQKEDKND